MARILVADDADVVREALTLGLTARGYEVTAVANGLHALAQVRAGDFDLVICDLMMPILGGVDAIEAIRRHRPELPIIVVSADDGRIDGTGLSFVRRVAQLRCLQKPFRLTELALAVSEALCAVTEVVPASGAAPDGFAEQDLPAAA
jgi:CheY-like chemotaxis protein